ncbi:MAG: hypothetical protein E7338_06870 [Clostridiales bacterium]|nr:hypothetical protein [Clostridiales bacterium]
MLEFIKDFLGVLWGGISEIFIGIFKGLFDMFNFPNYYATFVKYSGGWSAGNWVVAILIVLVVVIVLAALIWLVIWGITRIVGKLRTRVVNQDLVDEIHNLKRQIIKLNQEKDRILGMKVTGLGNEGLLEDAAGEEGEKKEGEEENAPQKESRFYKLTEVDAIYASENAPHHEYDDNFTLEQLCDRIRNYAANNPERPWRKLYYEIKIIRLFIASMATSRLIILQGISGTGKTSLPECLGHFFNNETTIASVQPSWRDRTEIFGYFNEFTKRFNETEVLKKMYEATYNDDIYITVLDEMNIARVEYYFAEMLSILEMPSRAQWVIDLVPSGWPSDPKHVEKGRFRLPENMWYVGTANNDDSTFAISDKVYDRGMPININSKAAPFDAPLTENFPVNYKTLEALFAKAQEEHKVSDENLKKFEDMDDYVIAHFRLAFGNRIVKQLREFVPVYVACGGTEIDGLDYVLCNKILRKFESLNLGFIRDEIDAYIQYLSDNFGEENMTECKEYLARLKKLF